MIVSKTGPLHGLLGLWYLFGRVGRLGEDGLPVRPNKHDEKEVEEDQVDNWREKLGVRTDQFSASTPSLRKRCS